MSDQAAIPVLICIDVEPDAVAIPIGRHLPWRGYECSVEAFQRFRAEASAATGAPAHFTWFYRMDPQVEAGYDSAEWPLSHYEKQRAMLIAEGDDLGLHVHAYRWSDGRWQLRLDDQAWIDECFVRSAEAFQRVMGHPCRSYRTGDHWFSQQTGRLLEDLGALYDLTLEPGHPEVPLAPRHGAGALPDFTTVPERPYRPSRSDYRVADDSRIDAPLYIPMTTAAVRPGPVHALYDVVRNGGRPSPRWTALLSQNPLLFRRIVTHALNPNATHLGLPVRSSALADRRLARRVRENLRWLLGHPLRQKFKWSTPAGAAAALRLQPAATRE